MKRLSRNRNVEVVRNARRCVRKKELKPCPFCHCKKKKKKVHIISRRLPFWWFIECDNCHSCGETKLFLRRAVKAWNRRVDNGSMESI